MLDIIQPNGQSEKKHTNPKACTKKERDTAQGACGAGRAGDRTPHTCAVA